MNLGLKYCFVIILLLSSQCKMEDRKQIKQDDSKIKFSYPVMKAGMGPFINSDWDKEFWDDAGTVTLNNYMGDKPEHFPETSARIKYDSDNIYLIFRIRDNYIRAIETKTHGKVWHDSCVEFFFSPGADVARGYFNFEVNCKGVFLFEYHLNNGNLSGFVDLDDCKKIRIAYSLQEDVSEELAEPRIWTVEYCIPLTIISKYMDAVIPGPGATWRANFYKCADKSSHPHWLTWAPADNPFPNFHMPEFFGTLNFQ